MAISTILARLAVFEIEMLDKELWRRKKVLYL